MEAGNPKPALRSQIIKPPFRNLSDYFLVLSNFSYCKGCIPRKSYGVWMTLAVSNIAAMHIVYYYFSELFSG